MAVKHYKMKFSTLCCWTTHVVYLQETFVMILWYLFWNLRHGCILISLEVKSLAWFYADIFRRWNKIICLWSNVSNGHKNLKWKDSPVTEWYILIYARIFCSSEVFFSICMFYHNVIVFLLPPQEEKKQTLGMNSHVAEAPLKSLLTNRLKWKMNTIY